MFWQSSSIKYFLTIKDVTGALRRVLWHFSFQQPPQCCPDSLPNPVDLLSRGERYEQQTWLLFKLGFESSELPMGNFSSRFWSPYSFSPFISAWTVLTATCTCTPINLFEKLSNTANMGVPNSFVFFFPKVLLVPQQVLLTAVYVNSRAKNGRKGQELQEMERHNSDSTERYLSASALWLNKWEAEDKLEEKRKKITKIKAVSPWGQSHIWTTELSLPCPLSSASYQCWHTEARKETEQNNFREIMLFANIWEH